MDGIIEWKMFTLLFSFLSASFSFSFLSSSLDGCCVVWMWMLAGSSRCLFLYIDRVVQTKFHVYENNSFSFLIKATSCQFVFIFD